jgi:acetoin utilization protein AcuB
VRNWAAMLAQEIMTRRPVTGTPRTPIRRAQALLRRGRFRHLPIVSEGRLQGVLSDRDLQRALAAGRSEDEPVAALVRTPAITAGPDTPVEEIARLLQDNKIGCVPIVGKTPTGSESLVGIVTESDVLAAFVRAVGIAGPGSPVVVIVGEPATDLGRLGQALAGCDAPLLSLVTEPLPSGQGDGAGRPRLRLTLRLGTINPGPIRDALRAAGLEVERPHPEDAGPAVTEAVTEMGQPRGGPALRG